MLARSFPPERTNRVKLFRAAVKRSVAAGIGIGGATGAGGTEPGGGPPGAVPLLGGAPSGPAELSSPSQLGTRGVLPPGPPNDLYVPICGSLLDYPYLFM